MKKICILCSACFVGQALAPYLKAKGYEVWESSLRRDPSWETKVMDCDAVVNLAGEPIFGRRWNTYVKAEIFDSRVDGTKKVVEALRRGKERSPNQEKILINASAIGFYGSREEEVLVETDQPAHDFLAFVCKEWEQSALSAERALHDRTVVLRFGIILGRQGGALKKMLLPFKLGLGGPIGFVGKQWMSWIHIQDVCGLIHHAIEHPLKGIYNAVSPSPVRSKEFAHTLGQVLGRPALLPTPKCALRILVGEASYALSESQRVSAEKTLESGFNYQHPHLKEALEDLLKT